MYRIILPKKTTLNVNQSYEGETLEKKIRRIVNNKEPITDAAPIIYTERKDGVLPEYDIRTDRMEIAVEKMDYIARASTAKRENAIAERAKKGMEAERKSTTTDNTTGNMTGGQSTQGTN